MKLPLLAWPLIFTHKLSTVHRCFSKTTLCNQSVILHRGHSPPPPAPCLSLHSHQLQHPSLVIHTTKGTMTVLEFYCLLRMIYGGIHLTDAAEEAGLQHTYAYFRQGGQGHLLSL